jgi:threonine/homoserine/homoserine lactone efflux protein
VDIITPAFLASSAVVIMAPGADLALITRQVVRHGRRPALTAAAGMITAGALQGAAGFAGMALLLRDSPSLFAAFRLLGAVTLAVFGVLAIRAAAWPPAVAGAPAAPEGLPARAYWQGLACTGLNPKVGMFLVAYLPQFVPSGASLAPSMLALTGVYLAMGLAWLVVWTILVHRMSQVLLAPRLVRVTDLLVGAVLVTFALRLALGGA